MSMYSSIVNVIKRKWGTRAKIACELASQLYLPFLLLLVTLLWFGTDQTWWITMLAFAPRWPWLIPAVFAIPIRCYIKKTWWPIAAILVIAPILLGFQLPITNALQTKPPGVPFTVVTMNIMGKSIETETFAKTCPKDTDVIFLQECNAKIIRTISPNKWESVIGSAGVCIVSRHPIKETATFSRPHMKEWGVSAVRCIINTKQGPVRLVAVHLRSPRDGIEAVLSQKWQGIPDMKKAIRERREEATQLLDWIHHWEQANVGPLVIAGDFNTPIESRVYQENWSTFRNAFNVAGLGIGATKFTRWHGLRIDHILCERSTAVLECYVGKNLGSDHRAVIAKLVFANQLPLKERQTLELK